MFCILILKPMGYHAYSYTMIIKFADRLMELPWRSQLERSDLTSEVPGSTPIKGSYFKCKFSKSVFAKNPRVVSSNPGHDDFPPHTIICI